jgi:hypothetical protein
MSTINPACIELVMQIDQFLTLVGHPSEYTASYKRISMFGDDWLLEHVSTNNSYHRVPTVTATFVQCERPKPMTNPKQLVEFTAYTNDADRESTVKAFMAAFFSTHTEATAVLIRQDKVRCTVEQFGLYIIKRVELGVKNNQIRVMHPKLVETKAETLDVSKRA